MTAGYAGSLDDDPAAIRAVIMRDPCSQRGESAFGWVTTDDHDGLPVTRAAEYHADDCPLLAKGAYVIAVMPHSAVMLAGHYLRAEDFPANPWPPASTATAGGWTGPFPI